MLIHNQCHFPTPRSLLTRKRLGDREVDPFAPSLRLICCYTLSLRQKFFPFHLPAALDTHHLRYHFDLSVFS